MSRIAKNPIKISKDVECSFKEGVFSVKGKLGQMQINVNPNYNIDISNRSVVFFSTKITLIVLFNF